jgi:uncharacterized membrane protein
VEVIGRITGVKEIQRATKKSSFIPDLLLLLLVIFLIALGFILFPLIEGMLPTTPITFFIAFLASIGFVVIGLAFIMGGMVLPFSYFYEKRKQRNTSVSSNLMPPKPK